MREQEAMVVTIGAEGFSLGDIFSSLIDEEAVALASTLGLKIPSYCEKTPKKYLKEYVELMLDPLSRGVTDDRRREVREALETSLQDALDRQAGQSGFHCP